jgi:4-hydroxy-3-methylbut-2-enyl diphosphate reductase
MKVIVAETAGFCNGVKSALEVTLEAIQKRRNGDAICTFGPLIHNRHVLDMLERRGVSSESSIEGCSGKKVVIRAHGIPPEQRRALHQAGAVIVNATCKRVAKVQAMIKRYANKGYHTVIVGDEDHAEVVGLMGYAKGRSVVINLPEHVEGLPGDWRDVLLVAQTTQNEEIFREIEKMFLARYPAGIVKNTICGSTQERQAEVRQLCRSVDAMVIVGGYQSGNTVRLAEIARECGIPVYHVETENDLSPQEMAGYSRVGVSAGASTPNWMIRNVVRFLESIQPEYFTGQPTWNKVIDLLAYSNVFVAVGAAILACAVAALTGLPSSFSTSAMAAFYVFGMHTLNRYLDHHALQLNDPARAAFYQKWQVPFVAVSIAAVLAALWIAQNVSLSAFWAMLILVLLGILYGAPLIRATWQQGLSTLKIKDIPASKTLLIPVAWACVTTVLPHFSHFWQFPGTIVFAFWIVFLLVLIRTALLDFLDVQGDYLVGRETIVVFLGEAKTNRFIKATLALLGVSLVIGPAFGLGASFALWMLPSIGINLWCLTMCRKNLLKGNVHIEALIESIPIGVGVLGFLWLLVHR